MNLRASLNTRVTSLQRFRMVAADAPQASWRHPWQTQAGYSPRSGGWFAFVNPGLVNGEAPIVRTTATEQRQQTGRTWHKNPLTGKPFFSDPIFNRTEPGGGTEKRIIEVPLYLSPAIPLRWRPIGFDGLPGSALPLFFRRLGAAARPGTQIGTDTDLALADTSAFTEQPPEGLRLLRACDIILHQPRAAVSSSFQFLDPIAGQGFARQTITLTAPQTGDRLRLFAGDYDGTPNVFSPLNGYTEDAFDEMKVCTIYLLSPRGAALGSSPDGSWTPYVQHDLFWNLNYRTPAFQPVLNIQGANPLLPLAVFGAGILLPFLQYTWSILSDAFQQAFNLIQASSQAGTFFTSTGGGSTSQFPVEDEVAVVESAPGFAHSARLRNAARAADLARRQARLDPPFPYRARAFPTAFFS
jgi:hypothetical protein